MHVKIHVDGGSRGNPGLAGAGIVISAADDGTSLQEAGVFIGKATNNVAEYTGLIEGLRRAQALGATRVDVLSDSELMVKQINGDYRVKNAGLRPLYEQALRLATAFEAFSITHVRRELNTDADRLANQAMNRQGDVEN